MVCPVCRSDRFYVKDPEDEFETYPFQLKPEGIVFQDSENAVLASQMVDTGEIFCSRCAWHGSSKRI